MRRSAIYGLGTRIATACRAPRSGSSQAGSVQSLEQVELREVSQGIKGEGLTVRRGRNAGDAEAAGGVVHLQRPDQLALPSVDMKAIYSRGQPVGVDDQSYSSVVRHKNRSLRRLHALDLAGGRGSVNRNEIGKGLIAAHDQKFSVRSYSPAGAFGRERLQLCRSRVEQKEAGLVTRLVSEKDNATAIGRKSPGHNVFDAGGLKLDDFPCPGRNQGGA